jgi:putative aldouronate transport system permease protein
MKRTDNPSISVSREQEGSLANRFRWLLRQIWKHRLLYLLLIPGIAYFLIFRYTPLFYAQLAFRDFRPALGVLESPFVGFKHFQTFFNSFYFDQLLGNTIIISIAKLLFGMPPAIILAIALSETRLFRLGRLTQTVSYLPHFLSWVVMFGILLAILSPNQGFINQVLSWFGIRSIAFLTSPDWFRAVLIGSDIWKETGWAAILYLAALLAIDPTLYEAAEIDGASRLQRIWHISLPGLKDVIVLVTLLRLGSILDAGFGQIFVLYSLPVYSVADVIDTWVYRQGILNFQFGLATAVGLFKGVIGLLLIVTANRIARRLVGSSLY